MPDRPDLSGVPGLGRRDLVAEVAAESAELAESTQLASTTELADETRLADLVVWAQSAGPTKAAAYYLPADARDLVEWLRRYVPAGAEVPTRSEVVAVAIRIAAEVVSQVTGEPLPG